MNHIIPNLIIPKFTNLLLSDLPLHVFISRADRPKMLTKVALLMKRRDDKNHSNCSLLRR